MRSLLSKARFRAEDPADRAVEAYEAAWRARKPSLGKFWEGLRSSRSIATLAELVKVDLRRRFEAGERPRAAEYFDRFAELTESDDRVVSLVYEEFCLLQEAGEDPDSAEFCEVYGAWRDSLLSQLAYHRQLSQAIGKEGPPVKFPEPGDRFERYQIRSLLGSGGVARVYLATEDDLGGRKVALKVSASFDHEPSILANLDHRSIVPILATARSESGLQGFSMPYRPGLSLEELLRRIGRGTPPRSARALWKALSPPESGGALAPDDRRMGWTGYPIGGTFAEGVAWIGLALAQALAYLHGEKVIHRDIKPANILLSFGEGPQLLDFNLAQNPRAPEQARDAFRGGTLPYMAPEHLRAFLDPSRWEEVDSAADIFSLGLVLRELITGRPPDLPSSKSSMPRVIQSLIDRRREPPVPVREFNPLVPASLESIISKCLSFDPEGRYASASDLAEDLRRFLDRRPLRHAPNTSKVERGINFTVRNRYVVAGVLVSGLVLLTLKVAGTTTPIRDLSQFRRAVVALDSRRAEDWDRARLDFDELRHSHAGSAWPLFYLGLAQEQLGGQDREEASKNIIQAIRFPDAEEAIAERLKSDPRSATALTALGMLLMERKEPGPARVAFERAIAADPKRIKAILYLVDLEAGLRNHERAIELLTRAIEVAEREETGSEHLYELRKRLGPQLVKRAETFIDSGSDAAERGRAASYLERLEATLKEMNDDLDRMAAVGGSQIRRFTNHFYRGCLASGQSVLAADRNDTILANQLVGAAREEFAEARESIQNGAENQKQFLRETNAQRAKLEIRSLYHVAWRVFSIRLDDQVRRASLR